MKKIQIKIILTLLLFVTLSLNAQNNCNTEIIKTNPDPNVYYNPNDPNQLLRWDWRGDVDYSFYLKTGSTTAVSIDIKSPFWHDGTFNSQENVLWGLL